MVAALILGAASLALFGGTSAQWLIIFLAAGPLVAVLLANVGTGLNYYGIWRVVRGRDEYSARDDALTQGAGTLGNLQGLPAALGCGSLFSVGILAGSLIIAALSYLPEPLLHIGAGLPSGSPTQTPLVAQVTPTPFPTPTTAPSPTATQLPTATPSPTPIAFAIIGANASSPYGFSGVCSSTRSFSINGTIFAPGSTPGGNVTHRWARSDGSFSPSQTITFAARQS
jgi:hypothetical protein